jgi:hypothetical protein
MANRCAASHSLDMRTHAYALPALPALLALALAAAPASAQGRWKEIGKTSAGNTVYVDPHSVKHAKGIVTARLRVVFATPVATPEGAWKSSQHTAMFNCAKATVAAKENVYYADVAGRKVVERSAPEIPGYGSVIGGSMTKIALDYLCKT